MTTLRYRFLDLKRTADQVLFPPVAGCYLTLFVAGNHRTKISAPAHCGNPRLSLAATLQFYLTSTAAKRQLHLEQVGSLPGRLFIANTKPHQAVTPATLAR